jgi:hypothetical protein
MRVAASSRPIGPIVAEVARMLLPRAATLAVLCGILAACAVGCGSAAPTTYSSSSAALSSAAPAWTTVGFGVGGTSVGPGKNVLVVYGGYTATDADSRALALALNGATSFRGLDIGSIYASRGPDTAGYTNREIGNSEVARALEPQTAAADFILVIAHSSGAFVADELFTEASDDILAKIVYFALDGGTWALTDALIAKMKAVSFVYAKDSAAGESANASSMMSEHSEFAASHLFKVDSDGSGCNVGAVWCLHDTLVTTRPHDPSTYDLDDDYTSFTGTGRHVVTSYVDQGVAAGLLVPSSPTPPPPSEDAGADAQPGEDAGSGGGPDAGYGSCTTATGQSGACIDTAACAAQEGTSTADECPGPDDIQCCTGG